MTISVPICDLRHEPKALSQDFSHDDLRNSQMLFGESVEILDEKEHWYYIYAKEQGLFGWIQKEEVGESTDRPTHVICSFDDELPFGSFCTRGRALDQPFSRPQVVEDALLFLGCPYLWGGRSNYRREPIGSVDCSSLVNLVYRAQGILIPRDAGPQAAFAKKVSKLEPGDLIYFDDPATHLVMKIDDELFIEAPSTGLSVRLLKWGVDLWEEGEKIHLFDSPHSYSKHYRAIV